MSRSVPCKDNIPAIGMPFADREPGLDPCPWPKTILGFSTARVWTQSENKLQVGQTSTYTSYQPDGWARIIAFLPYPTKYHCDIRAFRVWVKSASLGPLFSNITVNLPLIMGPFNSWQYFQCRRHVVTLFGYNMPGFRKGGRLHSLNYPRVS